MNLLLDGQYLPFFNGYYLNRLKENKMFGLPAATSWVLFGFPAFWIIYTVVFLIKSKNWPDDSDHGGSE